MIFHAGIAAALGALATAMVWASQHGLAPRNTPAPPQDGEQP